MDIKSNIVTGSKNRSDQIKTKLYGIIHSYLFKNISTVFGGNTIAKAIGFFTTWVLVRHLSPSEYGIFSILDMVVGLSGGLIATGFNWSMIKSVATYKKEPTKAWYVARVVLKIEFVYGLIMALGLYLGADLISESVFHKHELLFYIRLCSIGVIGYVLLNYRISIFQAFLKFKLDALFSVGHSLCYLSIIILLLLVRQFNILSISIVYVTLPIIVSTLALTLIRDGLRKGKNEYLPKFFSILVINYRWLLFYTLCLWFSNQFHIIILSRYFSMKEVGYYGFAYKIYVLSLMIMNAIHSVLLPTFSSITEEDALKRSFEKALNATVGVSVLLLVSIPFLGMFVEFFAGDRYAGACTILQILIFGSATSTMLSPSVNALFALDKFKLIAVGGLIFILLNIFGHIAFTPRFGGTGAAVIQVLSHLVLNSYFTIIVYKVLYGKRNL